MGDFHPQVVAGLRNLKQAVHDEDDAAVAAAGFKFLKLVFRVENCDRIKQIIWKRYRKRHPDQFRECVLTYASAHAVSTYARASLMELAPLNTRVAAFCIGYDFRFALEVETKLSKQTMLQACVLAEGMWKELAAAAIRDKTDDQALAETLMMHVRQWKICSSSFYRHHS
jgi:hypothetical protein